MKKVKKTEKPTRRTNWKPMPIGNFALKISNKCFAKYGFNGPEMFFHWPYIVGDKLNGYSRPSRINWPRGRSELMADRLNSATLVINCLGAFALEIESDAPAILQRANMIFGYAALGKLRVRQHQSLNFLNILEKEVEDAIAFEPPEAIVAATADIKSDELRDALNSLGAQVYQQQITKK